MHVKEIASFDATKMKKRSQVTISAIEVLVDEHLIVESEYRVVQRGLVKSELDARRVG